jgi:Flp pilus assembly protein TadG
MFRIRSTTRSQRGQMAVIFGLLLVVMVAMVGLVLDGGSALAQRREEQNASDLGALAGANTYLLTGDSSQTTAAARAVAAQNGYTHGSDGVTVDVTIDTTHGAAVKVDILAPHPNTFSSVIGFTSFQVAADATALSGIPDTVAGAGPMIFSIDAFDSNGEPLPQYGDADNPYPFNETNGDVPTSPGDIAWTNYGTGNLNTSEVEDIILGDLVINKTLSFGEYIGQHNNGNHNALYTDVNDNLAGTDIPVPVVDHAGNFQGWATFHVVSAQGGSAKHVVGYIKYPHLNQLLTVGDCSINDCPRFLGSYVLKLVD